MRAIARGLALVVLVGAAVGGLAQDSSGAVRLPFEALEVNRQLMPHFFPSYDATTDPRIGESLVTAGVMESGLVIAIDPALTTDTPVFYQPARAMVVYTLRDGLTWRDGTPITAYDTAVAAMSAFYDYPGVQTGLGNYDRRILGAFPLDARTLVVFTASAECGVLEALPNFTLIPIDRVDPAYRARAEAASAGAALDLPASVVGAYLDFIAASQDANINYSITDPTLLDASPRGEVVRDAEIEQARLLMGDLPVALVPVAGQAEAFQSAEIDVIINPRYETRASLRALPGVQIVEPVGRRWYALGFNFADPTIPLPPFDRETGVALDQGVHPIFGDARVREAVAMGLDLTAIAEAATAGHYALMHQREVPWLPAAHGDPAPFDPFAAGELLESIGWSDWDRDGIRECHGCATAEDGRILQFTLLIASPDPAQAIAARVIGEQLRAIGMAMQTFSFDESSQFFELGGQTFDAYLSAFEERDPVEWDRAPLFRRAEDYDGANVASYFNPDAEAAFDRADSCDVESRREALNAAEAILLADRAIVPLFAGRDFYAAHGAVVGFDPRGRDPLWNIETWRLDR